MNPESKPVSPLDNLSVAAPCHAKWSEMTGDERARFCQLCHKHVYNLSAMSRADAEALVKEKEGRVCVRFYRRADGTVITDNCPVGLRRVRDRLRWIGAGLAALLGVVASGMIAAASSRRTSVKSWFVEEPQKVYPIMGALRIATPPTPPPPPHPPAAPPSPSRPR